ncbi:drug resistance transporter, EmrB/QacA subfamily [Micromonospora pallida]|uniref:Drug resistance transporter, EmrB/QacA subfamily n=1 Tax=Micromonospora pallida TaxID=145854 RepID=A0A1C6SA71_9ACTN|nr:MFS transporter [Micromonospora pallida]SCL26241.1 drug resistance transporter, EmrB/QacA subfamily [Micromonospora pallida]
MTKLVEQPHGDSHGGRGETVVPLRIRSQRLRSLRQRQLALLVVCAGALVAAIDGTAVYVALPDIQKDLGFTATTLAWVVNAYLIPFGGLLLLAGKLGDTFGAKRVFLAGLTLFTVASAVCGLADDPAVLVVARFLQGAGGALTTAVVLSMIVMMFPKRREQSRALGLYAFVASSGAAIGLLAGAALTQWLSWQWIFFVNVPVGALTIAAGLSLLDNVQETREREGIDWFGALALVAAMMLTVYTIAQSADHGWASSRTLLLGGAAVLLLAIFAFWQTRARHPLMPMSLLRRDNVGRSNLVLALMVAGPAAMFFLTSLYLRDVLGFTVIEAGFGFLPATVAVGVGSLKVAPRLLRRLEPRTVLAPAIVLLALGLLLLARIPADGNYVVDVLPAVLLMGTGSGLATPPLLQLALGGATTRDSGLRSGLINTTQQIGSAIGLAVLTPVAAAATADALGAGESTAAALTGGYRAAFLVGLGMTVASLLALLLLRSETAVAGPAARRSADVRKPVAAHRDPTGAEDADFLALGLGGTNMLAMLWSIAMGRRAVGLDLRGDPFINLMHWKGNRDLYHHLALLDRLLVERYGEDRLPQRGDGQRLVLHETFYLPSAEGGSGGRSDEILSGWHSDAYFAGLAESFHVIDDRWVDGRPNRAAGPLTLPEVSTDFDPTLVGRGMDEVLAEPQAFLIAAEELLILLRRYLEEMERMDLAAGLTPRCRIFLYHRVAQPAAGRWWDRWRSRTSRPAPEPGFQRGPDGRVRVRVEPVREVDHKGRIQRVRDTDLEVLDLGTPELVVIAEGVTGDDAARLGFRQEPVRIDHGDGRGPVVAQADYIFGLLGVYVHNNARRRISSMFDADGTEYWVRQAVIGHEDYAESAWTVVEVPDFERFDPIRKGMVRPGTSRRSAAYFGGYKKLIRDFFLEQASLLTGLSVPVLASTQSLSSPRLVTVVARKGVDAQVAPNVVVAGDSFGTGSFVSSSRAMVGLLGHACRVRDYWQERAEGAVPAEAIRRLADRIDEDTTAYLRISQADFAQPTARRADPAARERALEQARQHRRAIARFDPRDDWSRLQVFPGRLYMPGLPEISELPPELQSPAERRGDAPARPEPAVAGRS